MTKSAPIQLLDLVWNNTNESTSHSWERLNHAMRAALTLAVSSGMKFDIGDFNYILDSYRTHRWIGDSHEWVYSLAIGVSNTSATKSYETAVSREPFIADGVEFRCDHGVHGDYLSRERERLSVGATFRWKGHKVTVTSFSADQSYLIACSYKDRKEGEYGNKVAKRFKITRQDIIDDRAERKERDDLFATLTKTCETHDASHILASLGIETFAKYDAMPLSKIRKVVAKYQQSTGSSGA